MNKLVEGIRKILLKTIVPLKQKQSKMLSKLRFSMEFRISLNYMRFLIIYMFLFMILFIALYYMIERKEFVYKVKDIISLEENDRYYNPYKYEGISYRIKNLKTDEIIFDDIEYDIYSKRNTIFNIYIKDDNSQEICIVKDKIKFNKNKIEYEGYFQYNFTKNYIKLKKILLGIILIFSFITFCVIKSAKRGNIKLLSPIEDMTNTANKITVNNLHSERLNIEGTKNELRDLAIVFNNMLDRLETSYESQKQFISDASHELRTPIAVIQGYSNLLDRWGKKDEAVMEEAILAIKNESKSMQELVEKLLFLSRHDKKTLRLNKEHFNMKIVVADMIKETKMVTKNRIIQADILEDVDVYGDKQCLKQSIRIFIDNAVKYTKDGDKIIITCENNNGDCVVSVTDNGIGMKPKDVDNIFERFYRADDVRNKKVEGHGLGLSIAKLIILKHAGRIKVITQYKKGSKFIITLPKNIIV